MPEANQTEKATPQRRRKAREQGQVARSRELPSLLAIAGALGAVALTTTDAGAHWRSFYEGLLGAATGENFGAGGPILFWCSVEVLRWVVPAVLVAMLLSVASGLAQGGLNVAPAALQPKFERFHPGSRIGQIFSLGSLSSLGKSLIPFGAILLIGCHALRDHWTVLVRVSGTDTHALAATVVAIAADVCWKSALVLLLWAGVDYGLVWRQSENQLRMSREELKQEHKETDGNPHTKQQVRRVQRAMRKRRSLQAAASATLVVTNPTHFAVALRYEAGMSAPEVVAKGRDLLAQKIKQIAYENGVTVMENKALAQALYKTVEVGDSIPAELYQAVAELLVVVFRAQAELREQERLRRARNAAGEVMSSR
jgi:flagellar biosynthesis protein FlhB